MSNRPCNRGISSRLDSPLYVRQLNDYHALQAMDNQDHEDKERNRS